jgi:NADH-quinone oxidoreductase subunit M
MLNHGVSTGALFLIVGMLSDRRHTRLISEFGGLKHVMPKLVAAFFVITLSSIGLPGLNGFVGEFLILIGTFRWSPWFAAVAASGVILSAVYMLWMFQRVNYGAVTNPKNEGLKDLSTREWWVLAPAIAMAVFMGVAPWVFLNPMKPAVGRIVSRMAEAEPTRVVRVPAPAGAVVRPSPHERLPNGGDRDSEQSLLLAAGPVAGQPHLSSAPRARVTAVAPARRAGCPARRHPQPVNRVTVPNRSLLFR